MISGKMFNWLRGAALAGSMIAMTASAAPYGSTRANIPFDFDLAGKTMPAGRYEFRPGDFGGTLDVTGPQGKVTVIAVPAGNPNSATDPQLVFDKTDSGYRLKRVWVTGVPVGSEIPAPKSAKAVSAQSGAAGVE